ncbi:hypothetical protein PFICI_03431 [Pestalotiopsis fici W106-1]|uniref:mRNA-capping enzyme subunit alpha n=1 Tax=Pestalotiopsis fici (strain W106-1 / CGMCC3.15140) TaxID=1229662 RepID=W3XJK2_PESFW|nr:uncharacterized protein PFICI_03431 [Pestalotiopsis fici W106-1]ETS85406.1 hypothetical protein PFICI_03431 [Pestalotiopsis fici W106-1]
MDEEPARIQAMDRPGIRAEGDLLHNMQREVARLLNRESTNFPGAQPVSFARRHLEELRRDDYYVCEKSDGIRYLLYLTDDGNGQELHYLIDRKNDYWWVKNAHFPTVQGEGTFHRDTILDGELVVDTMPDGTREPVYLVFDCLVLHGQSLMSRGLQKRFGYFHNEVFKPYKKLFEKYPQEKAYQPFILGMKEHQLAYGTEMMFRQIIPNLHHGNDGLIFTCLSTEYKYGTDPHILKWKPAEENTVDFRWKFHFNMVQPDEQDTAEGVTEPYIDYDGVPRVELLVFHGGKDDYRPFGELHMTEDEWEELKALNEPLDERIVEAYMDEQRRWRFYRFRDDKHNGNHVSVVNSVLESIEGRVTKEELIEAAPDIRSKWKRREAEAKQGQRR